MRNRLQTVNIYPDLTKRSSKVQEKNMSCERALTFDQWKTFSENYKPMRVWLRVAYKFTEFVAHDFFLSSFKLNRGSILPLFTKYVS